MNNFEAKVFTTLKCQSDHAIKVAAWIEKMCANNNRSVNDLDDLAFGRIVELANTYVERNE